MKRNSDKRPTPVGTTPQNDVPVEATDAAKPDTKDGVTAHLKNLLEAGKESPEELARLREGRIDAMLAKDPDWPARKAAWERLLKLLGIEGEPELDARHLEHKHWKALQQKRHGKLGARLRETNAVLDDPAEYEK